MIPDKKLDIGEYIKYMGKWKEIEGVFGEIYKEGETKEKRGVTGGGWGIK